MHPSPAIVTQLSARRLPRWVLLLLGAAYILPGLLGRQPWRNADLTSFGVMLDMVRGSGDWLHPQILGEAAPVQAWLPYWLGALSIKALPFLPPDTAVRLPFGLLLTLTLICTWYAMYHLARLPQAQPVTFAFGGEAQPDDYAHALADTALLTLVASLGLATLSHESTPDTAQLAFTALLLYASARLASAHAERRWLSALVWFIGVLGLALSGAPWLGLTLGLGWLVWLASAGTVQRFGQDRWWVWGLCTAATVGAAWLAWELELPRRVEVWSSLEAWLHLGSWQRYGRLLAWFTWPSGVLCLWTLWRWRGQLFNEHIVLPLWFALAGLGSAWLLGVSDRALLMALPALACLGAFALPTLSRSVTALIDWFAVIFFTAAAALIWVIWLAMTTGVPAQPAANVAKLAPAFEPTFAWALFIPALVATLIWLGVVSWRVGKHKPAIWKSLTLSSSGLTLCWLLLMTLWLPLLNHGMGQEPISRRIAGLVPPNACVWVHGLTPAQIVGLQYHGELELRRFSPSASQECAYMVVHPNALEALKLSHQWTALASVPRLRENRDHLLVYRSDQP